MALRPYWSGQIRLSLVTLPVNLYAAISSARQVPLHEIYKHTGERVRHQKMVEDKPIDKEDIVKGFEYEKNEYVLLKPEEIEELKIPSKKTLDIVQFVKAEEIDPIYFERPYYVAPEGEEAEDAFVVIREALRSTGKLGLGQLVIGGRERLCAIRPCGSGMMLETLRYKEEIRKSDPYFADIDKQDIDKEQLDLAKELISRKTGHFDPNKFHDHYREALRELIDAKLENRAPRYEPEERPAGKVINLMDALKKSLGASAETASKSKKGKKASPPPKKKPARSTKKKAIKSKSASRQRKAS